MLVYLLAGLRRHKEVTPSITVQRAEQTPAFDHFPQPRHHRPRGFFLHQLRIVNPVSGIVQDHNQVVPALVSEPLVFAPVNVQQHARQWPSLSPPPVFASLAATRHQPGSLQCFLHPGVAQMDSVFFAQLLVKMPDVQIKVHLPIQP